MKFNIILINKSLSKTICESITATLPDWFGIPEANERYAKGVTERISFAAVIDNQHVGMITLEILYQNNANIYWLGVRKEYHGQHIGRALLRKAENYCSELGISSLTVETLSPKQSDPQYLKTYHFYKKNGFYPLFEMHTYDPENLMVYMQKTIGLNNLSFIDLTHPLSSKIPHWGEGCGFNPVINHDYHESEGEVKFRVQYLEMRAGIGTHMDAPKHCFPHGFTISELKIEELISPCVVIDSSEKSHEKYSVSPNDIHEFENQYGMIPKNAFVICSTGWDRFWNTPEKYRNNLIFPSVSKEAAALLLERNVRGLGIDTLSPDRVEDGFPVHHLFLGANKYIIENIANSKRLPPVGASIIALPIKIEGGTEAPIRLIGAIKKE